MYRTREYAAAINLDRAKGRAAALEEKRALDISIISPKRLIDGGAAILAADIINHIIVIKGNRFKRPLVKKILRVVVDS